MPTTREKVSFLRERFVHRDDKFVHQWHSKRLGRSGYRPVLEGECPDDCPRGACPHLTPMTLTDDFLIEHLQGIETVGVYQLGEGDTIKWVCLDVDIKKGGVLAAEDKEKLAWEAVRRHTLGLARRMRKLGLDFLVESSGSRGMHLWIFFAEPVPAIKGKALAIFLEGQVEPPDGISLDLFPKQISRRNGDGNLVKVPLGVHRKSEKRCLFVNAKFEPHEDQWSVLANVERYTENNLDAFIEKNEIDVEASNLQTSSNKSTDGVGSLATPCMVSMMRGGLRSGNRDIGMHKLACYLRDRGLTYDMAHASLEVVNTEVGLDDEQLESKVRSAFNNSYSYFPCQESLLDEFCSPTCPFYADKMKRRKAKYGRRKED